MIPWPDWRLYLVSLSVVDYKLCHCLQIVIVIALVIALLLADAALPEDIRFFDREIDIDNRPKNPALIMNRWSGGGKVEQFADIS
ncbi:MAG: hypothetical protein M9928_12355 [Anaerolineae bacterium]|nr:hypothetical protein [Anaerolineae bacterium]